VWLSLMCLMGLASLAPSPFAPQAAWAAQADSEEATADTKGWTAGRDEIEDPALAKRRQLSLTAWMIRASGGFRFLIMLVSFVMLALIVSLAQQLRRDNYLPAAVIEQFERQLDAKDYQGAFETAKASDSFVGRLLAAGMGRLRDGYEAAEAGMQEI